MIDVITGNSQIVVGVPVLAVVLWVVRLLYQTTVQLRDLTVILFGIPGSPPGLLKQFDKRIGDLEGDKYQPTEFPPHPISKRG